MRASKREHSVLAALLLAFTFLDLPLSQAVFDLKNPFGRFFEIFGETPGLLVGAFSAAALLVTRDRETHWKNTLSILGFGLLGLLLSLMGSLMVNNYLTHGHLSPAVILPAGLILFALLLFLSSRLDRSKRAEIRRLLVAAIVVINLIKVGWGRPRLRSMTDPAAQFVPWYLPQSVAAGEEFKSFPSGHTANAAVLLWISLLPTFIDKLKGKEPLLLGLAWVWVALVAFSRIIMGAHFGSDVTVGVALTYTVFIALRAWKYRAVGRLQTIKTV
mgnify:CR=1 FL=1